MAFAICPGVEACFGPSENASQIAILLGKICSNMHYALNVSSIEFQKKSQNKIKRKGTTSVKPNGRWWWWYAPLPKGAVN